MTTPITTTSSSTGALASGADSTLTLDVSDPGAALLAIMLTSRGAQVTRARETVDHANEMLKEARAQLREAMQRAADAQEDSSFWDVLSNVFSGDVTAIVEVVAAAAVVAATGGTGAVAMLAVAGAALTTTADIGKHCGLDPSLCAALGAVGAIAGVLVGNAAGFTGLCADISKGAEVVKAGAEGAGAVTHAVSEERAADADDARADATEARGKEDDATFRFDEALASLRRIARDLDNGQQLASNVSRTSSDGRLALVAGVGAA